MRNTRTPPVATVAAVAAVLALAVLAPLLGRGFVLNYDMVFAPEQALLPDSLGLGSMVPRSVPADAVVAVATWVLAGDLVQKLVLFLALFGAALGAGRLVPTPSVAIRIVAAVAYGWSAYVAERLFMGHWPYLLAYACLPWIAGAGLRLRRGEHRSSQLRALAVLVLACAPACLTPTGGILAVVTAVVCAGIRRSALTIPVAVVLNAPWLVPSVLLPGGTLSAAEGVAAFAARAENWGGAVLSLLGTGGIWNAEVTPASRGNPLLPLFTLAMLALAVPGLLELARRWGPAPARALLLLGAFGVLLAALGSVPLGMEVVSWAVRTVPGGGLLRDGQKWVAWWALPLSLGFALGVERAAGLFRGGRARRAIVAAAVAFPVLLLPDLAWAGLGRLDTTSYPQDWERVRTILAEDQRPGDVLTLPLATFRQFGWNAGRTQLDPAPRVLTRPTIIDDTVVVGGRPIPGEDRRVARVRAAVRAGGADLGRLGVGWVLVEHGTPGRLDPAVLAPMSAVYHGKWLSLYRVPGDVEPNASPGAPRLPVLAADLAALVTVLLSVLWLALPAGRVSHPGRHDPVVEE